MSSTRDTTARSRIRVYLRRYGPVEDPAGRATARLMEAVDYRGTATAFIQLITAMSKDLELRRLVRGKRTYRISLVEAPVERPLAPHPRRGGARTVDYDEVARKLLAAVGTRACTQCGAGQVPSAAELRAERDRLREDCESYARLVDSARRDLLRLLGEPVSTEAWEPEAERAARALLTGLRRGAATGEQAG